MKPGRQEVIRQIISEKDICTQHELLEALQERGIDSTQATVSRDIRDMHLVKMRSPAGVYRYTVSEQKTKNTINEKLKTIFRECVVSFDIAQNLFIIKTIPGLASAACSALDAMELEGLVGTIAGDDTAFLAMSSNEAAQNLYQEIERLF